MAFINGKEIFFGVTGFANGVSAKIINDILYIRSGTNTPDEPIEPDEPAEPDTPDEPIIDGTNGLAYTLSEDGTYYVCSGLGTATDTDIVIGSHYNGLPVKVIGIRAFYSMPNLTSVTMPNTITRIETEAFAYSWNIGNIVIPESVTSIDYLAFACMDVKLTKCTFKGTPSIITYNAFNNCKVLKDIYVPWAEDGVLGVPWGATNATIHYNSEV